MSNSLKKPRSSTFRLSFFGAAQVDVNDLILSDKVGRQLDAMSDLMDEQRKLSAAARSLSDSQASRNKK